MAMLITRGYWDLIGWNMLKHGETLWNCFLAYIHLRSIFPGLKNATRKSFSFIHCFASSNKSQVFFIFMSFHVLSIFVRHVWLDKLHPPISFGSTFIFSWIQWIQHSIHVFTGWWFGTCFIFPFTWECHHPNWLSLTPSFFRGVGLNHQPV